MSNGKGSIRGERRRRDEVYVAGMKRIRKLQWWRYIERSPWVERNLGLRKFKTFMHAKCSKKTHGQPKIGRGCKHAPEASPKVARHRLKDRKSWKAWDMDSCER